MRCQEPLRDQTLRAAPCWHRLLAACAEWKLEGIVLKRIDRPYRSGPTKDWSKVKRSAWREVHAWQPPGGTTSVVRASGREPLLLSCAKVIDRPILLLPPVTTVRLPFKLLVG
jgi:hypothetical protein